MNGKGKMRDIHMVDRWWGYSGGFQFSSKSRAQSIEEPMRGETLVDKKLEPE